MTFKKTKLKGVFLIYPELHEDERGYFFRSYCKKEFKREGLLFQPVQTNESLTKQKGTIRGLHFQSYPFEEAKIVRCVKGKVFDVVIDLRRTSLTYLQWESFELSEKNHALLYIPKKIAHGFQTLTDDSIMEYQMSQFYKPGHSTGIRWDDPTINVRWPITKNVIVSKKDAKLSRLNYLL